MAVRPGSRDRDPAVPPGPEPVTVTVARGVAAGREDDFERWSDQLTALATRFPGFLGAGKGDDLVPGACKHRHEQPTDGTGPAGDKQVHAAGQGLNDDQSTERTNASSGGNGRLNVKANSVGPCASRSARRFFASSIPGMWPSGTHHNAR